jgi:hypothetical protein
MMRDVSINDAWYITAIDAHRAGTQPGRQGDKFELWLAGKAPA